MKYYNYDFILPSDLKINPTKKLNFDLEESGLILQNEIGLAKTRDNFKEDEGEEDETREESQKELEGSLDRFQPLV